MLKAEDWSLKTEDKGLTTVDWRLKTECWRLNTEDWRLKTEYWRLNAECWRPKTEYWRLMTEGWWLKAEGWRLKTKDCGSWRPHDRGVQGIKEDEEYQCLHTYSKPYEMYQLMVQCNVFMKYVKMSQKYMYNKQLTINWRLKTKDWRM